MTQPNEQLIEKRLTEEQLIRAQDKILGFLFHTSEHETNVVTLGRQGIGNISQLLQEISILKSELQQTREELEHEKGRFLQTWRRAVIADQEVEFLRIELSTLKLIALNALNGSLDDAHGALEKISQYSCEEVKE